MLADVVSKDKSDFVVNSSQQLLNFDGGFYIETCYLAR